MTVAMPVWEYYMLWRFAAFGALVAFALVFGLLGYAIWRAMSARRAKRFHAGGIVRPPARPYIIGERSRDHIVPFPGYKAWRDWKPDSSPPRR